MKYTLELNLDIDGIIKNYVDGEGSSGLDYHIKNQVVNSIRQDISKRANAIMDDVLSKQGEIYGIDLTKTMLEDWNKSLRIKTKEAIDNVIEPKVKEYLDQKMKRNVETYINQYTNRKLSEIINPMIETYLKSIEFYNLTDEMR